jgi:hypothetical protein
MVMYYGGLLLMLLLLASSYDGASTGGLHVPAWDWEPARDHVEELCLHVSDTRGQLDNTSVTWRNNSRSLFLAVPAGPPPPGGWPVLVDLLTVNYPSGLYAPSDQQRRCGLDGRDSAVVDHPPTPPACTAVVRAACGATAGLGWRACFTCVEKVSHNLTRGVGGGPPALMAVCYDSINSTEMTADICPPPPPLSTGCRHLLQRRCPYASFNASSGGETSKAACRACVFAVYRNISRNRSPDARCTFWENRSATSNHPYYLPTQEANEYCLPFAQGAGRHHHNDLPGNVRSFKPFDSPYSLGMQCSCINTSRFSCGHAFDDGQHGAGGFVPRGGSCDDDVFFGGLWHQRLKQYLLVNGVAILDANNYVRDGWDSWDSIWDGGYDMPFFRSLAGLLGSRRPGAGTSSLFGRLNAQKLAFRGWSGGAHMVSFLFDRAARGQLPGLGVVAGVMMAGGSMSCYNVPPFAKGWCSRCNAHNMLRNTSGGAVPRTNNHSDPRYEWWHSSAQVVAAGDTPSCMFCCPSNYTEDWYHDHPEEYASHPFTLLAQTEVDNEADSSAAANYHHTMVGHGVGDRSELHYLPRTEQRCGCLGQRGGDGVPLADSFARFCKVGNQTCLNHTQGFPSLVEPATEFLLRAFAQHRAAQPDV